MTFDFDTPIDRSGTHTVKWDGVAQKFGRADVQPLWIADMDFASPPCVVEALTARARHPIYGYTLYPASPLEALAGWCERRHCWSLNPDCVLPVSGVLAALSAAVQACTSVGDAVIVPPPVYPGFFSAVEAYGRRVLHNPLRETDGHYTIDFAGLETRAEQGAKALLLCNPHNPVGRAWNADELTELLRIARRHRLTIISDEVHGDLALPGSRYVPLASVAQPDDALITLLSPSKTFNLQGLGLAVLAASRDDLRQAIRATLDRLHLTDCNPFAIAAAEAAWREGGAWLDALLAYLGDTRDMVAAWLRNHLPTVHVTPAEATYLLWLDFRGLSLDDDALRDFLVNRCKLGMNPGTDFGPGGSGHARLNIGAPRQNIEGALASMLRDTPQR